MKAVLFKDNATGDMYAMVYYIVDGSIANILSSVLSNGVDFLLNSTQRNLDQFDDLNKMVERMKYNIMMGVVKIPNTSEKVMSDIPIQVIQTIHGKDSKCVISGENEGNCVKCIEKKLNTCSNELEFINIGKPLVFYGGSKPKELITTKSKNIWWDDYYVNNLTKKIKATRDLKELSKFTSCSTNDEHNEIIMYPLENAENGNKVSVIRYPGMTIGHVSVNKDNIIFEVMIYTKEFDDMKYEIVPKETVAEIQKYIGYKLVFID